MTQQRMRQEEKHKWNETLNRVIKEHPMASRDRVIVIAESVFKLENSHNDTNSSGNAEHGRRTNARRCAHYFHDGALIKNTKGKGKIWSCCHTKFGETEGCRTHRVPEVSWSTSP